LVADLRGLLARRALGFRLRHALSWHPFDLVAAMNEPVARRLGLDQGTVADGLHARLDGLVAGYIQEGDERVDILVRFPASQRRDVADLASVHF
jgi:Cu/Ag efflux pump CusA